MTKRTKRLIGRACIAGVLATLSLLVFTSTASAWDCPSGQIRQQAPAGTPTTTPYYDVVEGIAFICVPSSPTSPTSSGTQNQSQTQNQNSSQNQSQTNSQNSTQNTSNQNVSSSGSISKSNSSVNNSGNSSNSNSNVNTLAPTLTASGGTSNSSVNSTNSVSGGNATNNSSGNTTSYSESYNEVRQNPGAYAPLAFSTSPCTKGYSGGASTPTVAATLGIAMTDKGCDSRQTAAVFYAIGNPAAAAQILCSTSASKRAKLTLTQCLSIVAPVQVSVAPPINVPAPAPQIVIVPVPTPVAAVVPPTPVSVPAEKFTLLSIGECPATRLNVCNRQIDSALVYLGRDPRAEISIHGPLVTMAGFVAYVKQHGYSPSRIRVSLDDVNTIDIGVWSAE